jgi:hypothetical protein
MKLKMAINMFVKTEEKCPIFDLKKTSEYFPKIENTNYQQM